MQSRAVSGVRASPSNKADLGYTLRNTFSVTKGRHSMKVKGSSIAGAELPETHPAHEADGKISLDDLFARKYTEIRELASRLRWKGGSPTLGPTALANEAYLKLLKDPPDLELKSYDNLIGVFANAMRQILVDASRRKKAQKRDPVGLPENTALPVEDALTVDALLDDLKRENARQGRIVDCRFYLGMTVEETAAALNLSPATVEREWREAKARLGYKIRSDKR